MSPPTPCTCRPPITRYRAADIANICYSANLPAIYHPSLHLIVSPPFPNLKTTWSSRRVASGCAAHRPMHTHHPAVARLTLFTVLRTAIKHYFLRPFPCNTFFLPILYISIEDPFIRFSLRVPQARKVCSLTRCFPPNWQSLLPMIVNVRGNKANVRLDC